MAPPNYVEAYLSRADWGANPLQVQTGHAVPESQVIGIVEHHTVFALRDWDGDGILRGDLDDIRRYMRTLQHARPDLGDEVPYSWVIFAGTRDDTCVIAEGRGRGRSGAHTAGLNSTRYAFAIAGNTDADQPVTPGMVAGMRWLAATVLVDPEHAVAAIGHQQAPPYYTSSGANLNATGCPGHQGMSVLPQLQPPYRLDEVDTPTPQPSEEDTMNWWFIRHTDHPEVYAVPANLRTGEARHLTSDNVNDFIYIVESSGGKILEPPADVAVEDLAKRKVWVMKTRGFELMAPDLPA